jgi:hypothetical protein
VVSGTGTDSDSGFDLGHSVLFPRLTPKLSGLNNLADVITEDSKIVRTVNAILARRTQLVAQLLQNGFDRKGVGLDSDRRWAAQKGRYTKRH